jgi:hypothetical protein
MKKLGRGRDNSQRLHRTMTGYGLSRLWVAKSLKVGLATVTRWLQPEGSPSYRAMSDSYLKLLEYAINDPKNGQLYRNPPDPEGELPPRD